MYYYKIKIKYDGSDFAGFQWQNGVSTVQSTLNEALFKLTSAKVTTSAASRTDTGVHAMDQLVKICSERPLNCTRFIDHLNEALPTTIKTSNLESTTWDFKPSTASHSKEYRYFFTNEKTSNSGEDQKFIANISRELNLELMNECASALIGKHDFCNFSSMGKSGKSTIREIIFCELSEVNPWEQINDVDIFPLPKNTTSCYQLRIIGPGFLKQMIRHIVSGLWMVGSQKLSASDFQGLLSGPKCKKQLWRPAPANGLFLYRINF